MAGIVIALAAIFVPLVTIATILFVVVRRESASLDAARERSAELTTRMVRASVAQARVLSSRTRGTFDDGAMAFVELRLEVQPLGGAPYLATTEWELDMSALSMMASGEHVAVKIDNEEPEIIYPNVSWAELSRAYKGRSVRHKNKR